jgi:hypothetical protein
MSTPTPEIALLPGREMTLVLQAHLDMAPILPRNAAVVLRGADGVGINVPMRGQLLLDQRQQKMDAPPLLFIGVAVALLATMCLLSNLLSMLQAFFGGG